MHKHSHHTHHHSHEHDDTHHEKKAQWVVYLTAVTMVGEICFGYITHSMALLADGYHMASHVFALGLTWATYVVCRKLAHSHKYHFHKEKLLALSGFASAFMLLFIAFSMLYQSGVRFLSPLEIRFSEAIIVACIGLVVNAVSAVFLHEGHNHHDHSMRSAYMHVLADGLTSVGAIIALCLGAWFGIVWLDSLCGIVSSLVIIKWSFDLMSSSGKELIDFSIK